MLAVIEVGGKQYLVKENDILRVEKLGLEPNSTTKIEKVLLTTNGNDTKVGAPYIEGASVELKVRSNGLGKKVRTFKMKAKKRYKRLKGHRQPYTEVEVVKI